MIQEYTKIKARIIARKSRKNPLITVQLNKTDVNVFEDNESQNVTADKPKKLEQKRQRIDEDEDKIEKTIKQIKYAQDSEENSESDQYLDAFEDDMHNDDEYEDNSQEKNDFEDFEDEDISWLSS